MTSRAISDVVVIGAGPAGLAAALALGTVGADVVIAAPSHDATLPDARTTALLPSSIRLLENIGAWDLCAQQSAPLLGIRIVDARGGLLRAPEVLFKAADLGLPNFGANIANPALLAALTEAVRHNPRLAWRPTAAVREVMPLEGSVRITLAEGDTLAAHLAVGADGAKSVARRGAGIATRTWAYPQAAIAGTLEHGRAPGGITTELHCRAGPLTIVPLGDGRSGFVWVEQPHEAARLAHLEEKAFLAELALRLHGLLGALQSAGPRASFALSRLRAERMGKARVALVGEAAHVIPPIGAQGLNLGLRDAASLADCVLHARTGREDIGAARVLDRYQAARNADVLTRTVLVDLLNRSLLTDFLPLAAVRGIGLHLLANVPALRRLAVAGGLRPAGPLPPLMQPRHRAPGIV
jgi:2-octaprenyl-6-methoxyphenol hydroxylase